MLEGKVKGIMKDALNSASKKHQIPLKEVRIYIRLTDCKTDAKLLIHHKTQFITELKWNDLLGFALMAFKGAIVGRIVERLHQVADEYQIEKENVVAKVYAIDDKGSASLFLYNHREAVKQLDISALI
jgi:hypothetical protein